MEQGRLDSVPLFLFCKLFPTEKNAVKSIYSILKKTIKSYLKYLQKSVFADNVRLW